MKKITLVLFTLIAFQYGNAQQTISFETSGGYTLGNINGQNGWVSTPITGGGNVANQSVSDAFATSGTNSLKIDVDPALSTQANPVIGARYPYAAPIPYNGAVFSFDVNISEQTANSSDYIFGFINAGVTAYVTYIRFSFNGDILVLSRDGTNTVVQPDTNADWVPATTYNVRLAITGNTVAYFVDNTQIFTGPIVTAENIGQVRFIHDNYGGFAYIDNFRTNDEATASVNEFDSNVITHSFDKNSDMLTLKSSELPFNNVQLFNILGQNVMQKSLSQTSERLNLSSLKDGIYLIRVGIEGNTQTFKLLKQ